LHDALLEEITPEFLRELAADVKQATKGVWVDVELECYHCGAQNRKKVKAEIRDLAKIISMFKDLLEQAEGRPGTADAGEAGVQLIVERRWPGAGAADPVNVRPAS
jgi:hypothetical protein